MYVEPPPPYSVLPPVYERQPIMQVPRTAPPEPRRIDTYQSEPIGKVQFGLILSAWCLGITACCLCGCRR